MICEMMLKEFKVLFYKSSLFLNELFLKFYCIKFFFK